jgi:hypothetical protein
MEPEYKEAALFDARIRSHIPSTHFNLTATLHASTASKPLNFKYLQAFYYKLGRLYTYLGS